MEKNAAKRLFKAMSYDEMHSPVGNLIIITSPKGLHAITWDKPASVNLNQSADEEIIVETKKQLNEYFQNKRKTFDLPLVFEGTVFQTHAWKQLLQIPYASTISYSEQAERLGDKKKARAVGNANGKNPIAIVIPCHRVIGNSGCLGGFAGGIEKKNIF